MDLETTSINALDAEIVGIAISYNSDEGFYIPLSHETDIDQLDLNYVLENLKEILESSKIKKIGQNLKYDMSQAENEIENIRKNRRSITALVGQDLAVAYEKSLIKNLKILRRMEGDDNETAKEFVKFLGESKKRKVRVLKRQNVSNKI